MNHREILLLLALLCFLAECVWAWGGLRRGTFRPGRLNLGLMALGFGLQTAFLYAQGKLHGRCPMTSGLEVLAFLAWTLVLIYLVVGSAYRVSLLGAFTAPLAMILGGVALVLGVGRTDPRPAVDGIVDPWVEFHAAIALIAYGAFALASVAGVMFLIQERLLKNHRIGGLFYNMPSINHLGTAIRRLVGLGFLLLTLALLSASVMRELPPVPKLALIAAVWIVYGILFVLILRRSLPPRRAAAGAVAAFLVPLASLLALH